MVAKLLYLIMVWKYDYIIYGQALKNEDAYFYMYFYLFFFRFLSPSNTALYDCRNFWFTVATIKLLLFDYT